MNEEWANKHSEVLAKANKVKDKLNLLNSESQSFFRQKLLAELNHYSSVITSHTRPDVSLKLYDESFETLRMITALDNLLVEIDTQIEKEKYGKELNNIKEEVYDDYTDELTDEATVAKGR